MNQELVRMMKKLRLSGMLASLEVRLQEAAGNQLSPEEFLELILSDEIAVREDRSLKRRLKAARFRELKRIDEFDFSFNTSINKRQIMNLATCRFIRERRDVLFIGPPGVGKSHLAQAIGYQAVKMGFKVLYRSIFDAVADLQQAEVFKETEKVLRKYLTPDLLIIDDMGLKKLRQGSGEYLFEIIMRRFEIRSTIMTSNRPLEDWGRLIDDVPTATAILDRFLSGAEIIRISGKSYRLKKNRVCTGEGKNDTK